MRPTGRRRTAYVALYACACAWLPVIWLINPGRSQFVWELMHPWAQWLMHGLLVAHAWFVMIEVGKMATED